MWIGRVCPDSVSSEVAITLFIGLDHLWIPLNQDLSIFARCKKGSSTRLGHRRHNNSLLHGTPEFRSSKRNVAFQKDVGVGPGRSETTDHPLPLARVPGIEFCRPKS